MALGHRPRPRLGHQLHHLSVPLPRHLLELRPRLRLVPLDRSAHRDLVHPGSVLPVQRLGFSDQHRRRHLLGRLRLPLVDFSVVAQLRHLSGPLAVAYLDRILPLRLSELLLLQVADCLARHLVQHHSALLPHLQVSLEIPVALGALVLSHLIRVSSVLLDQLPVDSGLSGPLLLHSLRPWYIMPPFRQIHLSFLKLRTKYLHSKCEHW